MRYNQFGVNDMFFAYHKSSFLTATVHSFIKPVNNFSPNFVSLFVSLKIAEATNSLRLSKLLVPTLKYRGENALLECQYELNNRSINNKYNINKGYDNERQYRRNNLYYEENDDDEEVLYSVKWYKDGDEFYRFVPRANPPQNSYSFDGIKVDVSTNA